MICEKCGKLHDGTYGSGRFCSSKCSHSFSAKSNNSQRIENIKIASDICIKEGRHNNFSGNGKIVESYWKEELDKHGLKVEQNYPISCEDIKNNNHFYYMDFLVEDSINLEIDGHIFHKDEEKDKRRDDYLKEKGYLVYRVPYINPKRRYEDFMDQVTKFVEWCKGLGSSKVVCPSM